MKRVKTFGELQIGDSIWICDFEGTKIMHDVISSKQTLNIGIMVWLENKRGTYYFLNHELNKSILLFTNGKIQATTSLEYLKSILPNITYDITYILNYLYDKDV